MLTLGSPLESLSTNGAPRVYRGEYTWQQTVPLTQLNLGMQARDLERMNGEVCGEGEAVDHQGDGPQPAQEGQDHGDKMDHECLLQKAQSVKVR